MQNSAWFLFIYRLAELNNVLTKLFVLYPVEMDDIKKIREICLFIQHIYFSASIIFGYSIESVSKIGVLIVERYLRVSVRTAQKLKIIYQIFI
jgi:hypothetical protein